MEEEKPKHVNLFIKIEDGKESIVKKTYNEKKNPACVEFKEIDSNYLDIYYDYSSYTTTFATSLLVLLIIMPITGYLMFILFQTSFETIIFATIVIVIILISAIFYVKFRSFEYIFDKEDDTFTEIKSNLGIKREENFKLSSINEIFTEKIEVTYIVSIFMKDQTYINLYRTQNKEEADDFATEIKNFLNI